MGGAGMMGGMGGLGTGMMGMGGMGAGMMGMGAALPMAGAMGGAGAYDSTGLGELQRLCLSVLVCLLFEVECSLHQCCLPGSRPAVCCAVQALGTSVSVAVCWQNPAASTPGVAHRQRLVELLHLANWIALHCRWHGRHGQHDGRHGRWVCLASLMALACLPACVATVLLPMPAKSLLSVFAGTVTVSVQLGPCSVSRKACGPYSAGCWLRAGMGGMGYGGLGAMGGMLGSGMGAGMGTGMGATGMGSTGMGTAGMGGASMGGGMGAGASSMGTGVGMGGESWEQSARRPSGGSRINQSL